MSELTLRNHQSTRSLDLRLFRKIARDLLRERLGSRLYEIGVHFVAAVEMARLNETHLNHSGSTDVITFGYSEPGNDEPLFGDIFICVDDALAQARRFNTTWPFEIVRYFTHAVLHLQGYDDLRPGPRRVMKREENNLVNQLAARFALGELDRSKRRPPARSRTVVAKRGALKPVGLFRNAVAGKVCGFS